MLIQFPKSEQARRAELDGYERINNNAIETSFSDLNDLLDRDDVTVTKVSLHRKNGETEAKIINREIRNHMGKVEYEYQQERNLRRDLRTQSKTLFEIEEDSLTIRDQFRSVIEGDYDLAMPPEAFEELKTSAVEYIEGDIEELQDRIDEKRSEIERIESLDRDEYFDVED